MKKQLCNYPGCNQLADGTIHYCEKHKPIHDEEVASRKPFQYATSPNANLYNSRRWINLKRKIIQDNPSCYRCGISGEEVRLEVHHLIAPRGDEELFFEEGNCTSVCPDCHKKITAQEISQRKY
jgi:5-methylcytosine-specific restriction protein A